MTAVADNHSSRKPLLWFACFMYALGGAAAIILAVVAGSADHFLSQSWLHPDRPAAPLAYVPVTALWAAAGVAFCLAGLLTLRRQRAGFVVVVAAWVAGLLGPLLLPAWQEARQLGPWDPLPLALPFTIVWLVPLVPIVIGAAYALFFKPRRVCDEASA